MQKPQGYDAAQEMGEGTEKPLTGGHHMIIKQVNEAKTKNGKDMIVVLFDFAQNDRQPDLFMNQFKADTRPQKKWPRRGTDYIVVTDAEGNTSRKYKTFCSCFEKSNNVTINWTDDSASWCGQFNGKRIGGAFGVVHDLYNGKEITPVELRWYETDSKVDPNSIPKERELTEEQQKQLATAKAAGIGGGPIQDPNGPNGFMNIPDGIEEELPFA